MCLWLTEKEMAAKMATKVKKKVVTNDKGDCALIERYNCINGINVLLNNVWYYGLFPASSKTMKTVCLYRLLAIEYAKKNLVIQNMRSRSHYMVSLTDLVILCQYPQIMTCLTFFLNTGQKIQRRFHSIYITHTYFMHVQNKWTTALYLGMNITVVKTKDMMIRQWILCGWNRLIINTIKLITYRIWPLSTPNMMHFLINATLPICCLYSRKIGYFILRL